MTDLNLFKDLVIVLGVALLVVSALRKVGVPTIAGFIVAGALVGPNGLGLVMQTHEVEVLAEVGVVLLLFGIGLELSLDKLRRLWKAALVGGAVQMSLTLLATAGIGIALGLPPATAVFLGFVVAVSSTAIVLRGLSERGELEAPHGSLSLAILVFQDLSVVPMILVVPLLAGSGGSAAQAATAFLRAAGFLVALLVLARLFVPRLLGAIARTRQRDLFVLSVFVVCFGTAWGASLAGISLALGAFLGGLVVAGSEYRHQALSDLIPQREVLSSVFFVSVGMLLSAREVTGSLAPVLALLLAILAGKFVILLLTAAAMRLPLRAAVLTAAGLCQVGEFSFVLLNASRGTALLDASLRQTLLTAIILSMLVTPLLIRLGPHLASGAARASWFERLLQIRAARECPSQELQDHVILAGYGLAGERVAEALRWAGRQYVVVDLNAETVRRVTRKGEPAFYGDVTSPAVLESLGIDHAAELVVAVNDPGATERAVRSARDLAPGLRIVARTQYAIDGPGLRDAGADEVITAETEAAERLVQVVVETEPSRRDV